MQDEGGYYKYRNISKKIADKINELTKKDFANGKEKKNEQSEIGIVRKRRGR